MNVDGTHAKDCQIRIRASTSHHELSDILDLLAPASPEPAEPSQLMSRRSKSKKDRLHAPAHTNSKRASIRKSLEGLQASREVSLRQPGKPKASRQVSLGLEMVLKIPQVYFAVNRRTQGHATMFEMDVPFVLENLLLVPVDAKIWNGAQHIQELNLAPTKAVPLVGVATDALKIAIRIPDLRTAYSKACRIVPGDDSNPPITVISADGLKLDVCVDMVGSGRLVLYATHWMYDLTGVMAGLRISPDKSRFCAGHPQYWEKQVQLMKEDDDDNTYNDKREPIMFSSLDGSGSLSEVRYIHSSCHSFLPI